MSSLRTLKGVVELSMNGSSKGSHAKLCRKKGEQNLDLMSNNEGSSKSSSSFSQTWLRTFKENFGWQRSDSWRDRCC